jgi:hypothetical protein
LDSGAAAMHLLYFFYEEWREAPENVDKDLIWRTPPSSAFVGSLWTLHLTKTGMADDAGYEVSPEPEPPCPAVEVHISRTVADNQNSAPNQRSMRSIQSNSQLQQRMEHFAALERIRCHYFAEGLSDRPVCNLIVTALNQFSIGSFSCVENAASRWCPNMLHDAVQLRRPLPVGAWDRLTIQGVERNIRRARSDEPLLGEIADFRSDDEIFQDGVRLQADEHRALSKSAFFEYRFRKQLDGIRDDERRVDTIREVVRHLPEVQEIIGQECESVRTKIERELAATQGELATARTARDAVLADVKVAEARLAELRAASQIVTDERVSQLIAETFAGAIALINHNAPTGANKPLSPLVHHDPRRSARTVLSAAGQAVEAEDVPEVLTKLSEGQRRCLLDLLACWACGVVPVLVGSGAAALAQVAATRLVGGALHWVDVPGRVSELHELFGTAMPGLPSFTPHPNGLSDLWLDGMTSSVHPVIVAFDSVERCDVAATFLPVIRGFDDPDYRLPVRGFCRDGAEDPFLALTDTCWPRHFLPILLYAPTPLPHPASFWRRVAVVDAGEACSWNVCPADPMVLSTSAWQHVRATLEWRPAQQRIKEYLAGYVGVEQAASEARRLCELPAMAQFSVDGTAGAAHVDDLKRLRILLLGE